MEPITWQAPEFIEHKKPKGWYAGLWIVALGCAAAAILTGSFFLLALIVVATGVITLYAAKKPQIVTFSLTPRELRIGNKTHPIDEFSSFWIFEKEGYNVLSLDSRKVMAFHGKVFFPDELTGRIRRTLLESLDEVEHTESLADEIADRLRF